MSFEDRPDHLDEEQNTENRAEQAGDRAEAYGSGREETDASGIGQNGGTGQDGYGSYQSSQDSYRYHNYYDDRYRNGGETEEKRRGSGSSDPNGYGYRGGQSGEGNGFGYRNGQYDGFGGAGYQGNAGQEGRERRRKPHKKKSGARVAAAVLLLLVFIGFCGGISWLAVNSLEERVTGAGALQEEAAGPEQNPEETVPPEPKEEQEEAKEPETAGGQIASAGTIEESGNVTVVVTDVTDVVDKVMPACVSITNSYTELFEDIWGQSYSRDEEASGSGIIIGENEEELLVVTNNHVVDGANTLLVQFIDGEVVEAQVKGVDSTVDLAVVAIRLDDIKSETRDAIRIAQMGDSDNLKIGEPAIAIGNALGYGQSVTAGVISALNRTLEVSETGTSNALIQTDAAINPGNSGGALLNIRGEVVGINSNKIGSYVVEGMGYAIPISTAKPIIEELMTHETRSRVADADKGYLGISCINVTGEITETFGMPEGIFVAQVYEGTGADRAGLVRGDIITAVEGTTVRNQEELTGQLGYYKAGETVKITIMQGSPNGFQPKDVQVTLSSYDEVNAGSAVEQEAGPQQRSYQWNLP